jgi:hypothetical protein
MAIETGRSHTPNEAGETTRGPRGESLSRGHDAQGIGALQGSGGSGQWEILICGVPEAEVPAARARAVEIFSKHRAKLQKRAAKG